MTSTDWTRSRMIALLGILMDSTSTTMDSATVTMGDEQLRSDIGGSTNYSRESKPSTNWSR